MASKNVIDVTNENFDVEVLNVPGPVLVVFTLSYSEPCLAMVPVFEKVADTGKCKVCKFNLRGERYRDDRPIVQRYRVHNAPTLMVFRDGQKVWEQVGRTTHGDLIKHLG